MIKMYDKFDMQEHFGARVVRPHDHDFLELSYILSGTVEHTRDGVRQRLHPGDYLIVDFGSLHEYRACEDEGYSNVDFLFLPELLDPALIQKRSLRSLLEHYLLHFNLSVTMQNPAHMVFHDDDGRILELLEKIRTANEERKTGFVELVRCYMIEILIFTMRKIEAVQSVGKNAVSSFVITYVAQHYAEEISLCDVARQLNYSMSYVSRRFREEMGIGFARYLQNYRVIQACRLLADSQLSFSEIAVAVGYRDVKGFSELIRRDMGASPTTLRRQYRAIHDERIL